MTLWVDGHVIKYFCTYPFSYICAIDPDRDEIGMICLFHPQSRYKNVRGLSLNEHGSGPFCRFRVPSEATFEGVYTLLMNGLVQYAGECIKLSSVSTVATDKYLLGTDITGARAQIAKSITSSWRAQGTTTKWSFGTYEPITGKPLRKI